MAVTTLTPVAVKAGTYPGYPTGGTALTFSAVDGTDGGRFLSSGNDLLLVRNEHATVASTYTITGQADGFGRTASITADAIAAAGLTIEYLFLKGPGWANSAGYVILPAPADATNVKFCVLQIG